MPQTRTQTCTDQHHKHRFIAFIESSHTVLRVRRTDQRNSSWLEKVGVCTLILALRRVVIPQRCIDVAWGVLRTPAWALFTLFLEKE